MSQRHSHAVEGEPEQPPEAIKESGPGLRVFWGRLVALAFAIGLSFVAGWLVAPRNVDTARLRGLEAEVADARARIGDLESAAAETDAPPGTGFGTEARETPGPQAEDDGPVEDETSEEVPVETYVVKPGDTLQGIAQQFYEDPGLDDVIAEANGLENPALIHSGLELRIPERPEP